MPNYIFADRAQDTTATTGTGNITLAGAPPTGFQSFNAAIGVGPSFFYAIVGGSQWEVGTGVLSNSTTLVRVTILASSNAGSPVSFSAGTKNVFCTIPASFVEQLNFDVYVNKLVLGVGISTANQDMNRDILQDKIDEAIADEKILRLPAGDIEARFTDPSTDFRLNITDDLIIQGAGLKQTRLRFTSDTHFAYKAFMVSGSGGNLTVNDLTMTRIDPGEDPAGGEQGAESAAAYPFQYGSNVPGDLTMNRVKTNGEWYGAVNNSGNVDATVTLNGCDLTAWGQLVEIWDGGGLSDRRLHATDTYFRSAGRAIDPFDHTVYIHPHVSIRCVRCRWGSVYNYAVHHFSETGVPNGAAPKYVQYIDCVLEENVGKGIITPRASFAEIKGLTSRMQGTAIAAFSSVTVSGSTFWGGAVAPGGNFDATDVITLIGNTYLGHRPPLVYGGNVKVRSIGDRFFGTYVGVINTGGGDIQIDDGWWHGQTEYQVSIANGASTFTLPAHAQSNGGNDLVGNVLTLDEVPYAVVSNTASVVTITPNYAGATSAVVKALWSSFYTAVDHNGWGKLRVNRGRLTGTVTSNNGAFYVDDAGVAVLEINDTVFDLTGNTYNIRSNGAGVVRGRNNTFSGATPLLANSSGASYGFIQFNDAVSPTVIASQSTIQDLSIHYNVYHVNGTAVINKIKWLDNDAYQRMMSGKVTLIADDTWTLNDDAVAAGNVKLRTGSALAMAVGQTVTLVYDPATAFWYEIAGSSAAGGGGTAASTTEVLAGTDSAKFATPDAIAALWEQGSDVASAGIISLGEGGFFNITGSTGPITDIDFGTDRAGRQVWVKFASTPQINHSSTLILPSAANITAAAGDVACLVSEGSDIVRCVLFNRASGAALIPPAGAIPATPSTLVARDSSGNINANSVNHGHATTATAGGTTTLTVASANLQDFTGSAAQTVVLPVVSTLVLGQRYIIDNNSTGLITVQSSGANNVLILAPGTSATFKCILITGTTAASWNAKYYGLIPATGKSLTVSNSLTLAGTDGTMMTGPPASANLGYMEIPQNSQSAAYTCVLADNGKHILHPSADTTARIWTIPANSSVAYPIGACLTFVNQNGGGVITIAITTDTMRLAGAGTTGDRTLVANGMATAVKVTTTEWLISGVGLT